jgi:NAD(P)-dependent dehydrogenase (short-subunit alcohol dehydrogenase family)
MQHHLELPVQCFSRHVHCCRVIATCRNPAGAAGLQELQRDHPEQLSVVALDCTSEESIAQAAEQVSGSHSHLDLLLNVAGILHIPGKMSPGEHSFWAGVILHATFRCRDHNECPCMVQRLRCPG